MRVRRGRLSVGESLRHSALAHSRTHPEVSHEPSPIPPRLHRRPDAAGLVAAPEGAGRPGAAQREGERGDPAELAGHRQRAVDHHVRRQEDRQGADPLAGGVQVPVWRAAGGRSGGSGRGRIAGRRRDRAGGAAGQGRPAGRGRAAGDRLLRGRADGGRPVGAGLRGPGAAEPGAEAGAGDRVGDGALHRYPQARGLLQPRQEADDPREPEAERDAGARVASATSRATICASRPGSGRSATSRTRWSWR